MPHQWRVRLNTIPTTLSPRDTRTRLRCLQRTIAPDYQASFLAHWANAPRVARSEARHASHLRDECDLERGEVAIEVKATARPAIKPVSLAGKICDEVCYVRFKQQGTTLAVVEIRIRPRATGPGVKCRTTWLIGGPDSNGTPYQVVP